MKGNHADGLRLSLLTTVALGCSGIISPADAQGVTTPPDQAATEEVVDENVIVVTARGRVERLQDVPVAASVLDGAEAQRAGNSFAAISNLVPTLRVARSGTGTGGSISIRGIASSISNAGLEQKVALNIDGVQLGRARFIPIGFFDVKSVQVLKGPQSLYFGKNATAGVLSIESADPGNSEEGFMRVGFEAIAHEYQFEGAYSVPLSETLRLRVAGRRTDMTKGYLKNDTPVVFQSIYGLYTPLGPKTLPHSEGVTLRGTLIYEPSANFDAKLKITGGQYDTEGSKETVQQVVCKPGATNLGTNVWPGQPTEPFDDCVLNDHVVNGVLAPSIAANFKGSGSGLGNTHIKSLLATLQMNYRTDAFVLTSVTGFGLLDYSEFGNSASSAYDAVMGLNTERYRQYSQELRLASTFDSPLNFTLGAFAQKVRRENDVNGMPSAPINLDRGSQIGYILQYRGNTETLSAFGQLNWKFMPRWELTAGARYTHEVTKGTVGNSFINQTDTLSRNFMAEGTFLNPTITNNNLSPEVTLTWKPTDEFMVYAAYRTASLAGGISAPSTLPRTATVANMVFEPEEAKGYEAGIKFTSADSRVRANLTVFRTDYTDLQVSALNPATITYILRNVGGARTEGVEFGGDIRLSSEFSLRADATYANARYIDFPNAQCYSGQTAADGCVGGTQSLTGKPLPRAPKFVASVGAAYDRALSGNWNLVLNADIRFNSSYNFIETNNPVASQKSFATIDMGARIRNNDWDFALIGRNVTNKFFALAGIDQPRGRNGQVGATIARPREIVVQLTRNF